MVTKYQPMSLAALAGHLGAAENDKVRWKLVWEFLEEWAGAVALGGEAAGQE